jgi:hypothetical protein
LRIERAVVKRTMNPPWKITGYDSATAIYEGEAPSTLTEDEIATMLQRLAARHLSPGEVVAASLRKNLKGYAPLLECHIDRAGKKGNSVWTGGNPHYIAFRKRVV